MKLCPCGRPVSAGRTTTNANATRCLICETAALFEGWHHPVHPKRRRINPERNRAGQQAARARAKAKAARRLVEVTHG